MHFDPSLNALWARAQIEQRLHRFFHAVDSRQWESAAAVGAEPVAMDWPNGGVGGTLSRAALAQSLAEALGPRTTHHQSGNWLIEVDGDTARAEALVAARRRAPTLRGDDAAAAFSRIEFRLTSAGGEWFIAAVTENRQWMEGNAGLFQPPADAPAPQAAQSALLPQEKPLSSDAERLKRLGDHDALRTLMTRFGRALDSKDWNAYRACFDTRVTVDFSATTGRPAREADSDLFVEFASLRQRHHAAFHQYSNFQAHVDGDRARVILYLAARHRAMDAEGDALNVFFGWYDNECVRTADGWKIAVLRHPLQWIEGNARIKDAPDPAAEALGRRLFG